MSLESEHNDFVQIIIDTLGETLVGTFWGKRVVYAACRGHFLLADVELAKSWPTCACGKMYARKPFDRQSYDQILDVPTDVVLLRHGQNFYDWVEEGSLGKKSGYEPRHCIQKAAAHMVMVEARGTEFQTS